jgi:hypothetical protein
VDSAIDSLAGDVPPALGDLIARWRERDDVAALRDPACAREACHDESVRFAAHLLVHGLDAQDWGAWAAELGFAWRVATTWPQDDTHVVCAVRLQRRIYTVDWTAAQYGHRDPFPVVRAVAALPERHPWLLAGARPPRRRSAMRPPGLAVPAEARASAQAPKSASISSQSPS